MTRAIRKTLREHGRRAGQGLPCRMCKKHKSLRDFYLKLSKPCGSLCFLHLLSRKRLRRPRVHSLKVWSHFQISEQNSSSKNFLLSYDFSTFCNIFVVSIEKPLSLIKLVRWLPRIMLLKPQK